MEAERQGVVVAHKPSRFPSAFLITRGSILSPFLALVAASFIGFGIAAWKESDTIYSVGTFYSEENNYQYMPADPAVNINMNLRSFSDGSTVHTQGSKARVNFTVDRLLLPPVYLYYTMTNFYQSISYFHDGRNSEQLAGLTPSNQFLFRCDPFLHPGHLDGSDGTLVTIQGGAQIPYGEFTYYPCGTAAWSKFNDSLTLYRINGTAYTMPASATDPLNATNVEMLCNGTDFDAPGNPLGGSYTKNLCVKSGISRPQDVDTRFKPIKSSTTTWSPNYAYGATDVYLSNGWYANEPGHSIPDTQDLDFQVWMASAATPNFRKLYRIIHTPITPGTYIMEVDEVFDSVSYRGRKGFELRTAASWLVEPNYPLAGCYVGMGIAAFVASVVVGAKAFISSRLDAKEIAEQERRDAAGEEAPTVFSRFTGQTEEDRTNETAARKRWYTFDIHSEQMRQYVELRREREDIRKWQLANADLGDSNEDEEDEELDEVEEIKEGGLGGWDGGHQGECRPQQGGVAAETAEPPQVYH